MNLRRAWIPVLSLLLASSAMAEEREAAKEHFRKGSVLYNLSRWPDAAAEFEAAYQALNEPIFLYNIGQCWRKAADDKVGQSPDEELALRLKALAAYKPYLRELPSGGAAVHGQVSSRHDVEKLVVDLEQQIHELRERAKTAQTETEARLTNAPAAKEHFRKGTVAYNLGHWSDAATAFEAAYQARNEPVFLYNIGQCHRLAANNMAAHSPADELELRIKAHTAYKAYLREVSGDPPGRGRADIEKLVAGLEAQIQELRERIKATPAATTPTKEPAPRVTTPTAPNNPPVVTTLPTPVSPVRRRAGIGLAVGGLVVGAVGGLLVAVSPLVYSQGSSQSSILDAQLKHDMGGGLQLAGLVLAGVGVAAALVGIVVFATAARSDKRANALMVCPSPSGIVAVGTF